MDRISEFRLEQYLLGEAPDDVRRRIEVAPPEIRIGNLEASNRAILEAYPSGKMAEEIENKRKSDNKVRRFPVNRVFLPLAAAAVLTIAVGSVFLFQHKFTAEGIPEEITRIKGMKPHLTVYRKIGEEVETLNPSAVVHENDILQVSYNAAGAGYGAILSVDGRGIVTQHLPPEGEKALALDQEGDILLPFSYRLDDAPLYETFYFITSPKSFSLKPLIQELSRVKPGNELKIHTSAGNKSQLRQYIFYLQKEGPQ